MVIDNAVLEYTTVVVVGSCKMLEVCPKGVLNCQDVWFDDWFDDRPANASTFCCCILQCPQRREQCCTRTKHGTSQRQWYSRSGRTASSVCIWF